jgi:hypothetical protein
MVKKATKKLLTRKVSGKAVETPVEDVLSGDFYGWLHIPVYGVSGLRMIGKLKQMSMIRGGYGVKGLYRALIDCVMGADVRMVGTGIRVEDKGRGKKTIWEEAK